MATKKIKKKLRKPGSKSKNSAVKKIQSAYRNKQTRKKNKAAIKLQKTFRESISRKECAICLERGADFKTECNHRFHKECLKKWCKNKGVNCLCPLCRKKIEDEEVIEKDRTSQEIEEPSDNVIFEDTTADFLEFLRRQANQQNVAASLGQLRQMINPQRNFLQRTLDRNRTRRRNGGKKARKGPSDSATKFSVGTKKRGNDGNMWIIIKAANGTKRWKKVDKTKKLVDEDTVWGKNKKLENFWRKLALGEQVVVVYGDDKKRLNMPKTRGARKNKYKELEDDKNVKAIITSAQSSDTYESLYKKVKNKTPEEIIKNYKKYLTNYGKGNKNWYL
jgi:hypothetical protein